MLEVLMPRASLVVDYRPAVLGNKPFGTELSQARLVPWGMMPGTKEMPLGCVFNTFILFKDAFDLRHKTGKLKTELKSHHFEHIWIEIFNENPAYITPLKVHKHLMTWPFPLPPGEPLET